MLVTVGSALATSNIMNLGPKPLINPQRDRTTLFYGGCRLHDDSFSIVMEICWDLYSDCLWLGEVFCEQY